MWDVTQCHSVWDHEVLSKRAAFVLNGIAVRVVLELLDHEDEAVRTIEASSHSSKHMTSHAMRPDMLRMSLACSKHRGCMV